MNERDGTLFGVKGDVFKHAASEFHARILGILVREASAASIRIPQIRNPLKELAFGKMLQGVRGVVLHGRLVLCPEAGRRKVEKDSENVGDSSDLR